MNGNPEPSNQCEHSTGRYTCQELFNCCDCGNTDEDSHCGCNYCWSCNSCEPCNRDED